MEESPSSSKEKPLPLPPQQISDDAFKRLWIGNIDTKITEFHLLKVVEKYGHIEKFDFHYERTKDNRRKPKGYCFVTYEDFESARYACQKLNGFTLGDRKIHVFIANQMKPDKIIKKIRPPLFNDKIKPDVRESNIKIREIEEKLRSMKR